MQDLYNRIVELFGKSPDDPATRKFIQDLGEAPTYRSGCYVFPKSAFMLFCYKKSFVMACFHINTPASEQGGYAGNLPAGITSSDRRQDVQRKLGIAPESRLQDPIAGAYASTLELEDWYVLPPLRLWFTFNPENSSLNSFTVRYDREESTLPKEPAERSLKTTAPNKTLPKRLKLVRNYG